VVVRFLRVPFSTAGSTPSSANNGPIDTPQIVVDLADVDKRCLKALQDIVERAVGIPLIEQSPDGLPSSWKIVFLARTVSNGRPKPAGIFVPNTCRRGFVKTRRSSLPDDDGLAASESTPHSWGSPNC